MIRSTLLCLAGTAILATGAIAQQPGRQHGDSLKMAQGRPMMDKKMMARMDSADARLERMVSDMNRATGTRKIQAMSAVINELVAQRKQMRGHMQEMMEARGMMQGGAEAGEGPAMTRNMQPSAADTGLARQATPDTATAAAQPREAAPAQPATADTMAQHPDMGPEPARSDTADRSQPADSVR